MPLFKVLYIDSAVNCIAASAFLEEATAQLLQTFSLVCVFTVVNNAFAAIECTEHTCFDAIVIEKNLPSHGIDSLDFVRVLRNVGALTPIILLYENDTDVADTAHFCCALQKPFSANSLCEAILLARNSITRSFEDCGSLNPYNYQVSSEDSIFSSPQPSTINNNVPSSPYQDILMETLACLREEE